VTNIDARMKALKEELGSQHNKMKVNEYNKKRAIFEYLKLSDENGSGKMEASLNVARMVFVDGGVWKARQIRNWTNYWLLHNALPISYQGKHKKTI
jgi:CRISPR/Cas system-associated endonuclease/helicase Cas3